MSKSKVASRSKSGTKSKKSGSKTKRYSKQFNRLGRGSSYCTKCTCTGCRPNKYAYKFKKPKTHKSGVKRFGTRSKSRKSRQSRKSKSVSKKN